VVVFTASVAASKAKSARRLLRIQGGIVALTLPLARELAQFGIRVMTIAPACSKRRCSASCPTT